MKKKEHKGHEGTQRTQRYIRCHPSCPLCFFVSFVLLLFNLLTFLNADAQSIYAGQYNPILVTPPTQVPTPKTPDGALAGNGDIGLALGGAPDQLQLYIGKNDFWRAYPVYPGGGIAHPGGLTVSVNDLEDASYHVEQVMDKAAIKGKFIKDGLQLTLNTWVAATSNIVVTELTASKACEINLRLWSQQGNTSVNDSGWQKGVYWVTRSFENTPLLEWPCHIAIAMKVIGGVVANNSSVKLLPNKKITIALVAYSSFDIGKGIT